MPIEDGRRYEHRFHAGNVGDVWKHVALCALFDHLGPATTKRVVLDTHAGSGHYALGSTGEWTEGLGALLALDRAAMPSAVARYLALADQSGSRGERTYPGSPRFLAALSGRDDRVIACELDEEAARELARSTEDEPKIRVARGDGLATLGEHAKQDGDLVVLVDPPYADRREWQDVPEAILAALAAKPEARVVLWYPVKSWARPNAMLQAIEKAGVAATAVELITSPLTSKKNRLNGSGLVLFGAPAGLVESLASLAAWLGPRLAVGDEGYYTARTVGFSGAAGSTKG